MVKALLDTNILIDYLNAAPAAGIELARYSHRAISIISWIEVMVGAKAEVRAPTLTFLATFQVVGLDLNVSERAVELRREHRLKLPDAVIWASALVNDMILVTRNTKDFPVGDPGVRMPYSIGGRPQ